MASVVLVASTVAGWERGDETGRAASLCPPLLVCITAFSFSPTNLTDCRSETRPFWSLGQFPT